MKLLFTFLSLVTVVFWVAQVPDALINQKNDLVHQAFDEDAASAERWVQVKQCGSCHQQVYENWLKGPHANAYQKLEAHRDYVHRSPNFDTNYARLVRGSFKVCQGCHASENIYENHLQKAPLHLPEEQITWQKDNSSRIPTPRQKALETGIDCLTCHLKDGQVITKADFTPSVTSHDSNNCSPIASTFFSSNFNCISCHQEQVLSQEELKGQGLTLAAKTCVACHQEYDEHGTGTHYYYWRNNPDDKPSPEHLNPFADIEVKLMSSDTGNWLYLTWANTLSPHAFSECGEAIATVSIKDEEGFSLWLDTLRLNRKSFHDLSVIKKFGEEGVPGVEGYSFFPTDPPLQKTILLPFPLPETSIISIDGALKAQYWAKDEIAIPTYSKTYPVPKIRLTQ